MAKSEVKIDPRSEPGMRAAILKAIRLAGEIADPDWMDEADRQNAAIEIIRVLAETQQP